MQPWILFAIILGALVAVGASVVLFVFVRNLRSAQGPYMTGKYPQGHWMSLGMCIGIALGCIPSFVGLLSDQMAPFVGIGPAIGCGLGVAIGSALEQRHKDEIRPLTKEEQKTRKWASLIGLVLVVLGMVALVGILLAMAAQ